MSSRQRLSDEDEDDKKPKGSRGVSKPLVSSQYGTQLDVDNGPPKKKTVSPSLSFPFPTKFPCFKIERARAEHPKNFSTEPL